MAAYPPYEILLESVLEEESGVLDDFAPTGTQHSRILHSQSYYRFRLRHQLTVAEYRALKATYAAGKRDVYTLTYYAESPAVTYNVKFTDAPQIVGNLGLNRIFVDVPLRGTAA